MARYGINPIAMGQRINQQSARDALGPLTFVQNQVLLLKKKIEE